MVASKTDDAIYLIKREVSDAKKEYKKLNRLNVSLSLNLDDLIFEKVKDLATSLNIHIPAIIGENRWRELPKEVINKRCLELDRCLGFLSKKNIEIMELVKQGGHTRLSDILPLHEFIVIYNHKFTPENMGLCELWKLYRAKEAGENLKNLKDLKYLSLTKKNDFLLALIEKGEIYNNLKREKGIAEI